MWRFDVFSGPWVACHPFEREDSSRTAWMHCCYLCWFGFVERSRGDAAQYPDVLPAVLVAVRAPFSLCLYFAQLASHSFHCAFPGIRRIPPRSQHFKSPRLFRFHASRTVSTAMLWTKHLRSAVENFGMSLASTVVRVTDFPS